MRTKTVLIIGAGIGGLVSAIEMAAGGWDVTVLERASAPGGKMRQTMVGGMAVDAGPTVLTMRNVFDAVFETAGAQLGDYVTLRPAPVLARHAWDGAQHLDLFADIDRSADAIGAFSGAKDAEGYRRFCADGRKIFAMLELPYLKASRPSLPGLMGRVGLPQLPDLARIKPFSTLWAELRNYFRDPRLRQLFGRYATYCGSSPLLAPGTLMLIAHVEQAGVWFVEGGMHNLARGLARLAADKGVRFRYGAHVDQIILDKGRAAGLRLTDGERLTGDAVIANADIAALATGLFGKAAQAAMPAPKPAKRSLSALTWAIAARPQGFPLLRHNVFFSDDYPGEFRDIFAKHQLPAKPTIYVCAQDRETGTAGDPPPRERMLCLVNAPPTGDSHVFSDLEVSQCAQRTFAHLARCGLTLDSEAEMVATTPTQFNQLFPATGGALYGQASHGWMASFTRPGSQTRIPGLYLAGGSVHPGAGVPMVALSGRQAAASLLADQPSTYR